MSEEKFVLSKESAKGLQNLLRTRRNSNPQKLRAKNIQTQPAQVALVRCGARQGSSSRYWAGTVVQRVGDEDDGSYRLFDADAVWLTQACWRSGILELWEDTQYLAVRQGNSEDGKPVFVVGEVSHSADLTVGVERDGYAKNHVYTDGMQVDYNDTVSERTTQTRVALKAGHPETLEITHGSNVGAGADDGSIELATDTLKVTVPNIELVGLDELIVNEEVAVSGMDGLGSIFEQGICIHVGTGTGPAGADGADGADGIDGVDGAPGSVWRDGTGAPSSGLGINGDYYLDDATGNVYLKAAGSYSIVANIKGATGATGSTGSTGATGATGAGVPTGGSTGQALRKINGTDYNTEWFTIPAATAVATQANMESQASGVYVDPSVVRFSPSAAKAWLYVTMSGGTPTVVASYNISSITDNGVGDLTINFTIPFSAANYGIAACCSINEAGTEYCNVHLHTSTAPAAGSCRVHIVGIGTQGALDVKRFGMCFFGDQ